MSSITRKPQLIVTIAAFAAFLATFNETYLNVAFTPIMKDLGVDVAAVQWLATGYMLGAAIMVPVTAFLYRRVRTRPLFLVSVALLIAGSILCGLAPSFTVLLIGRIIQALGTGMLIPIGMNITLEVAPRHKLGTYMGIMGAMTTLGPSLSVIVAGLLLSVSGWATLMWVFAAMAALCFTIGALLLTDVATLTKPRLDTASVALISLALIGILYGISAVFSGNTLLAILAAALGGVMLAVFLRRQRRITDPLLDLRPLSIPPFALGVVMNMIALLVVFAMNIMIPIFLQSVLGKSELSASMALFPAIILACVIAPLAGRYYDKHGHHLLLPLGFGLVAVFTVFVAIFISSGSPIILALLYIPVICGSALVIGPVQSFALSRLTHELNPHGITVMSTGFQIAGCIGSSLFVGVYASVLGNQTSSGVEFADAAHTAFIATGVLASILAVIGFILALVLRKYDDSPNATRAAGVVDVDEVNGEAANGEAATVPA